MNRRFLLSLLLVVVGIFGFALSARASVPSASRSAGPYTCNGSTTVFSVPFRFLAASDLQVTRRYPTTGASTVLTLTTDYTVAGAGAAAGGSVTLVAGTRCPAAYTLTVKRITPRTQPRSLRASSTYSAPTVEDAVDRVTMIAQELGGDQDDLVTGASSSAAAAALAQAAAAAAQASAAAAAAAVSAAAAPGSTTPVTSTGSTTPRTLAARTSECRNVMDFGAKGDGNPVTDDSLAFNLATAQAIVDATGGKSGCIDVPAPPGGYYSMKSMWDLNRTGSAATITVRGAQSVIKYTGVASIEAVMKSAVSGVGVPASNKRLTVTGLVLDGGSLAFYGLRLRYNGWAEYAFVENLQVYNVTGVGIDLDGSMLSTVRHVTIEHAGIGFRVRSLTGVGGGNANQAETVHTAYCTVGILVYSQQDVYPMHNNLFLSPVMQGNSGADFMVAGGGISNLAISGGHSESSITAGSTTVDVGDWDAANVVTITKGRFVAYGGSITARDFEIAMPSYFGAHSEIEAGRLSTRASLTVESGTLGYQGEIRVARFTGTDVTLDRQLVESDGVATPSFRYADRSVVVSRFGPPYTPSSYPDELQRSTMSTLDPAAAATTSWDATYGRLVDVTFSTTTGALSPVGKNVFKMQTIRTWQQNESAYWTALLKASQANTTWYATVIGTGGTLGASFRLPEANTWYLVRATGSSNRNGAQSFYWAIYPQDTLGANLTVARMALLATPAYDTGGVASGPDASALMSSNASPGDRYVTATWDPASVGSGAVLASSDITVAGADLGDTVTVIPGVALGGLVARGEVTAANAVQIILTNPTGSPVDLASSTWTVRLRKAF